MDLCCPVYCAGLKLSRGGKVAKGKGDLSREKWSGAHRWQQGGNYWAGLRLRLRDSELLGRVEVAAGAASACRPWTKADTHGTSNRAVLHNSNLNIFENNWLPLCKKVHKVPGFFNVLSTSACRPDQGRYPRHLEHSCPAQFLTQQIFAKIASAKFLQGLTVKLGLQAWMYQIHHAPYLVLCLAKSVSWSSFQQMKAGCSQSKVLTFCEIW